MRSVIPFLLIPVMAGWLSTGSGTEIMSERQQRSEVEQRVYGELDSLFAPDKNLASAAERSAAVSQILSSPDLEVRESGIQFLMDRNRWIDLASLKTAIADNMVGPPNGEASPTLFVLYLKLEPREVRVREYSEAILHPHILGWGQTGPMGWAIREGLHELRSVILEVSAQRPDIRGRTEFSPEHINTALDLRMGAESEDEMATLGMERLSMMPAVDFRDRMNNSAGFHLAVANMVKLACEVSPYDGHYNRSCDLVPGILSRVFELYGSDYKYLARDERTYRWYGGLGSIARRAQRAAAKVEVGPGQITE